MTWSWHGSCRKKRTESCDVAILPIFIGWWGTSIKLHHSWVALPPPSLKLSETFQTDFPPLLLHLVMETSFLQIPDSYHTAPQHYHHDSSWLWALSIFANMNILEHWTCSSKFVDIQCFQELNARRARQSGGGPKAKAAPNNGWQTAGGGRSLGGTEGIARLRIQVLAVWF